MKILYYLKNLKIKRSVSDFLQKKVEKLKKFLGEKQEEALIEVELTKDKEIKSKEGFYKVKIILDLPKKSLIVAKGAGKSMMQAINNSFKKLFRQIRKKP